MIEFENIQKRLIESIKYSAKTQKQIAEECSVSGATITKYVHYNKFPSVETLAKLCVSLDVSADYILLGKLD